MHCCGQRRHLAPPTSSFSCYISSLVFTWLLVGIGRTVQRCFDRDKKRQGKETLLACRIYEMAVQKNEG